MVSPQRCRSPIQDETVSTPTQQSQKIATEVPWSDELTDYDRAHLATYLRILDALAAEASPEEMTRMILGIDPALEPERARAALRSHVERAQWMTRHGHLLATGSGDHRRKAK